nr:venom serine protease 34-like [Procambarus clarkii]
MCVVTELVSRGGLWEPVQVVSGVQEVDPVIGRVQKPAGLPGQETLQQCTGVTQVTRTLLVNMLLFPDLLLVFTLLQFQRTFSIVWDGSLRQALSNTTTSSALTNSQGSVPLGTKLPNKQGMVPWGTTLPNQQGSVPWGSKLPISQGNVPWGTKLPNNKDILSPNTNQELACGSRVMVRPGVTYTFTTPGYPAPYPPFTYCRWTFNGGSSSRRVHLTCSNFDLEASSTCSGASFLALQEPARNIQWFCGNTGPQNVVSESSLMSVHFWSSWRNTSRRGFQCTVSLRLASQSVGTCRCGREGYNTRVVGGVEAGLHQFPWAAQVRIATGFCGGTLINERFVLTAAHCVDRLALASGALPEVVLGEHDRSRPDETPYTLVVTAKRVIPHENYRRSKSPKDNDIGLIELATDVDLGASRNIGPACPPDPSLQYDDIRVTVIGWGYTNFPGHQATVLQKVELATVPLAQCMKQYQAGIITDNMICAAAPDKDACFDDSGGALMTKVGEHWQVVGVVSFGPTSCANPNVSGVYTRVANYVPWILSKIGDARTCPPP